MTGPWEAYAEPATATVPAGPWEAYADPAAEPAAAETRSYSTRAGGKVVRFDAPADASDEEVRRLAMKLTGSRVYKGSQVVRGDPPKASIGRSLGLGARDVIEGVASLPDLLASPLNSAINLATGADLSTTPFTDIGRGASDAIGLPVEEPGREQLVGAVTRGGTAALSGAGLAAAGARGGSVLLGELAKAPVAQTIAGAFGAGSADATRQAGFGPGAQMAAGLVGGVAAPVAVGGLSQGVRAAAGTMTRTGATDTAARTLQSLASEPRTAARSIRYAPAPVSDAAATLGEVSRDAGLAGLQRGLVNTNPVAAAAVGERMQINAIARTRAADEALGPGSPQRIQDTAAGRVQAARTATERGQLNARGTLDQRLAETTRELVGAADAQRVRLGDMAGRIGPAVDRSATGTAARDRYAADYATAKARTREAYNNPALEDNPPVSIRPIDPYDITVPDAPARVPDLAAFKDEAVRGARNALPPAPKSLLQLARSAGVNPASMGVDDLRSSGMDARGAPGLIRSRGVDADKLRELAVERGYLPENATVDDLVQGMVDEHHGGAPRYAADDLSAAGNYEEARANKAFWQEQFGRHDLDPVKMTDEQWRDFHARVTGSAALQSQPATLADLASMPSPGRLMGPFQQTLSTLRDRFFGDGGAEAPAYVRRFFDDVLNSDDTVGLKTLEGWERRAYDLAGGAPDRATTSFLNAIGRAIGAKASNEAGPARRAALETARAARRAQGSTFETGDVARAFGKDRYGNPTVPDTTLPTRLIRPGAPGGDAADSMIATMGARASERFAREEMRRLIDGATTPAQATALTRRYSETLARFPALRSDLDEWAAATGSADRAAAAAQIAPKPLPAETAALSAVSPDEAALKGTPLERVADPAVEPSSYVGQLLRRSDGGRELRRLVSQLGDDPEALAGARRAAAEYIETSGRGPNLTAAGDNVPSANPTRKAIQTVLQRGGKLITDPQRIVLQRVSRELEGVNFAASAGRPVGSETGMNRTFAGILGKQIMGVAGPGHQLLAHAFSLLGNGKQVQRLITEAVLDPKFAAELLTRATPRRLEALRARLAASAQGAATGFQAE